VRSDGPEVLAGASELDRPVRWVHTTELVDIGPLLRGGDLVLTTGIALPDSDEALERFVLADATTGAHDRTLVELFHRRNLRVHLQLGPAGSSMVAHFPTQLFD